MRDFFGCRVWDGNEGFLVYQHRYEAAKVLYKKHYAAKMLYRSLHGSFNPIIRPPGWARASFRPKGLHSPNLVLLQHLRGTYISGFTPRLWQEWELFECLRKTNSS